MVDESAWGSDYHMRSPSKFKSLCHHVHSPHYHSRPYVEMSSENGELFRDLECELSVEKAVLVRSFLSLLK